MTNVHLWVQLNEPQCFFSTMPSRLSIKRDCSIKALAVFFHARIYYFKVDLHKYYNRISLTLCFNVSSQRRFAVSRKKHTNISRAYFRSHTPEILFPPSIHVSTRFALGTKRLPTIGKFQMFINCISRRGWTHVEYFSLSLGKSTWCIYININILNFY